MIKTSFIENQIKEVDAQYERALKQLAGLNNTIRDLKKFANHLINVGDFSAHPQRMSNEAWMKRASEMIKELIKIDKIHYSSFNSVLVPIYIELRNKYGIVLDQLRKDYRYNNDTLRYPSAFEAISDDDMARSIFDSLLISLFPEEYFKDNVLDYIERSENGEEIKLDESPEEAIIKFVTPLAVKKNDSSQGYIDTLEEIYSQMDCSWGNLQTRYMKKNNVISPPSKVTIIMSNDNVLKKFKKTLCTLLENSENL